MEERKPFFFIWRQGGKNPKVKHESYEVAKKEAVRLSEKMHGSKFYILMEVEEVWLAGDEEWNAQRQREIAKAKKQ